MSSPGSIRAPWDHPRSRGENPTPEPRVTTEPGSSPLTRGKRHNPHIAIGPLGIIPAHAGKTPSHLPTTQPKWDHPRSRGENLCDRRGEELHGGSSPLTRGKRIHCCSHFRCSGIIPAHAGKTQPSNQRHKQPWDHPRSRGENVAGDHVLVDEAGSSPLTRGKQGDPACVASGTGIIPAHAGKTLGCRTLPELLGDHPRSRGENMSPSDSDSTATGSSPLTRGKRLFRD